MTTEPPLLLTAIKISGRIRWVGFLQQRKGEIMEGKVVGKPQTRRSGHGIGRWADPKHGLRIR
jgi:hypothetical protein